MQAFYNLEQKVCTSQREKDIRGEENFEHKMGTRADWKTNIFQTLVALQYAKKKYGLEYKLIFYFPNLDWFSKLEGRFTCDLQDKEINPFIMGKYKELKLKFIPVKNFRCDFDFSLAQNTRFKRKKIEESGSWVMSGKQWQSKEKHSLRIPIQRRLCDKYFFVQYQSV